MRQSSDPSELYGAVWQALTAHQIPLSADEIMTILEERGDRPDGAALILAIDEHLQSRDVIRLATVDKYMRKPPSLKPGALLLVCRTCGSVEMIQDGHIREAVRQRTVATGFRADAEFLECAGLCDRCGLEEE